MFGRCYSIPVSDVYSYDVTLPVVQHFRLLLDKMADTGKRTHAHACQLGDEMVLMQCLLEEIHIYVYDTCV